jgi:hypothetical protein
VHEFKVRIRQQVQDIAAAVREQIVDAKDLMAASISRSHK